MKSIRITQIKSGIDRNETAKRTLVALGLRKMNASREVEATPQILGMVKRVGHLIKVEDVESVEPTISGEVIETETTRVDVEPQVSAGIDVKTKSEIDAPAEEEKIETAEAKVETIEPAKQDANNTTDEGKSTGITA